MMHAEANEHLFEKGIREVDAFAEEVQRAMQCIAHNALPELEASVHRQNELLIPLSESLRQEGWLTLAIELPLRQSSLARRAQSAAARLSRLSTQYSALLQHVRKSLALLQTLHATDHASVPGQVTSEAKQMTWSCQA